MTKNKNFIIWVVVDAVIVILAIVGWQHSWFGNNPSNWLSHSSSTPVVTTGASIPAKTVAGNNGTKITIPAEPAPSTATSGPLDGRTYRIAKYDSIVVPAGEVHSVTFANGRITAKICNSIAGSYTAAYGSMSTKLMSTKMACTAPAGIMQLEQIFSTTLAQKATYVRDGSALIISGSGHSIVLQ